MRKISYAIDPDTGQVWSRVGSEMAIPVLDWDAMKPENNFATSYYLQKLDVIEIAGPIYNRLKWTRCIPVKLKNLHRVFFKFPPLSQEK